MLVAFVRPDRLSSTEYWQTDFGTYPSKTDGRFLDVSRYTTLYTEFPHWTKDPTQYQVAQLLKVNQTPIYVILCWNVFNTHSCSPLRSYFFIIRIYTVYFFFFCLCAWCAQQPRSVSVWWINFLDNPILPTTSNYSECNIIFLLRLYLLQGENSYPTISDHYLEWKTPSSNNQQTHHYGGAIANTADRPRQISPPHPWEPLQQGLEEGGVAGFHSIMPTGQEKK